MPEFTKPEKKSGEAIVYRKFQGGDDEIAYVPTTKVAGDVVTGFDGNQYRITKRHKDSMGVYYDAEPVAT